VSTPDALLDELASVAHRAAAAAVGVIHDRRPRRVEVSTKSTATDLVTDMDLASERAIREVVAATRPHDVVVGEEGGGVGAPPGGVTWWVDPIDGTTNYVYDHPGYNVSIAAAIDDEVVVGVVADPTHRRTYSAVRGRGAFCGTERLRLGPARPLAELLVATGFGYDPARRARQGRVVAELLPRIRDIRRMGAAALDLCSVAAGRVDAYYERGLSRWDLAAGALIATEAGARAGAIDGGPLEPASVLVCHPERFDELSGLLAGLGAHEV
jgi:myo-inositol-1(or 4)-monophosphatase